jgi:uncharacterized LabA/DUF88 family protein
LTDPRLKIAVFVDFDNIEIGVKTTLNQTFDISVILEAIKERGEVVTKVAYGDWKRAGEHGRLLSQHAIRLVQRNLTPGGDKNGADINLALDALEMAFTHHHINAFVIVGGDSDFITLVEKLKQYDKKTFVVGGRQFTSLVMQKNCHEFIAYENLVGRGGRSGAAERRSGAPAGADITRALPLVKRALKVLVDREVTPQLGLLKSTLLQLDSTFSEREYGVTTFRDFIEKVAQTGTITLRNAGRSLLVDLADTNGASLSEAAAERPELAAKTPDVNGEAQTETAPTPATPTTAAAPEGPQLRQAVEYAKGLFARAPQPPRWPMYVRQVKQYLRGVDDGFDERRLGFSNIVEFLRACQRENVIRLERDRQGGLRVFPGTAYSRAAVEVPQSVVAPALPEDAATPAAPSIPDLPLDDASVDVVVPNVDEGYVAAEPRDLDVEVDHTEERAAAAESPGDGIEAGPARKRTRRAGGASRGARKSATKRAAPAGTAAPSRSRKKAAVQS